MLPPSQMVFLIIMVIIMIIMIIDINFVDLDNDAWLIEHPSLQDGLELMFINAMTLLLIDNNHDKNNAVRDRCRTEGCKWMGLGWDWKSLGRAVPRAPSVLIIMIIMINNNDIGWYWGRTIMFASSGWWERKWRCEHGWVRDELMLVMIGL